jgi:uncharacterized SAM-binding protein YcdF (DUF218 family)
MRRVVEALLLPPGSLIWLFLLGTLLRRGWPRFGRAAQVFALLLLLLLSMPCVGGALLGALQTSPALPADGPLPPADAIVVLSAEADRHGAEYGGAVAGATTMQRLRYAAALQRRSGLPMLTSGGVPAAGLPPLAVMMARAATAEFGVPVKWTEDRSADTRENARFSAAMLKADGVRTVLLVTSAWHMPRAAACFRAEGIAVVAAPTAFRGQLVEDWTSFVPRWSGLRDTCLALHEVGGLVHHWLVD